MRLSRLTTCLALLVGTSLCLHAQRAAKNIFPHNPVTDIMLIYQGNLQRLDWTPDEFTPYVTHTYSDGSRTWLFDGFVFIEFATQEVSFINGIKNKRNATKKDWEWMQNRLFERGKALDALDKCIERQKAIMGDPPFRHKVILSLFSPLNGQTNWGKVASKKLNFNTEADQVKAVEWYMNELIKRFNAQGYKNFDLEGFYWVEEDTHVVPQRLQQQVSKLVHRVGKRFYWSPYYCASGCTTWDVAGFDYAYMQPNYVISSNPDNYTVDKMIEALEKAKKAGLTIEFDFDQKLVLKPDIYIKRFNQALDTYESMGLFGPNCCLLYYDGGGTLLSIYKGVDRNYGALARSRYSASFDRMARLIASRRGSLVSPTTPPYPAPGQQVQQSAQPTAPKSKAGLDWRDPEYWHF